MKRKLSAIFTATMCLLVGLTACASAPSSARTSASDDASRFREEKVGLPEDATNIPDMRLMEDGNLLIAATDAQRTRVTVFRQGGDGAWAEAFSTDGLADSIDDGSFMTSCLMPDGSLFCGVVGLEEGRLACYAVSADACEALPYSIDAGVQGLVPYDDGTMFVDTRTSLTRIDAATGEELCAYKLDKDCYMSDFAVREGVLYAVVNLSSTDKVETRVAAYDVETGEARDIEPGLLSALESALPGPVVAGAGSSTLIANGADGLYVCAKGNIYRCTSGSAERVLTGDETHLANDNEFPEKLLVHPDGDFAVLYDAGYATAAVRNVAYRYVKGERVEPTDTLTVYALEDNADVKQAAATFRDEHPAVAVEVQIGIPANSGLTADDALRTLNADLLAGTGPDVLVLDGLPIGQLIEQGMLRDLSGELDAVVADDSYYENVLNAFATDEGCCAVPTRFSLPAMVGDKAVLAQAETLEGLTSYLDSNDETRSLLASSVSVSALYAADRPALAGGDGKLDAEALASFFECTRRLMEMGEANLPGAVDPSYNYKASLLTRFGGAAEDFGAAGYFLIDSNARFAVGTIRNPQDFGSAGIGIANVDYPCSYAPLAFGGVQVFQPSTILGVSSSSDSAKAAGDFVAYLLGRSQQMRCAGTGLPVSKGAFEAAVRACGGYGVDFGSENGMKNYDREALSEGEIQECHRLIESATTMCADDKVRTDAVVAGLAAYCLEGASLDQAVAATMQKVSLYEAQ